MNSNFKEIGSRIKELRLILELSESELALACDLSLSEYLEIENGQKDTSFTILYKIANKLKIDISEIVSGDMPKLNSYVMTKKGDGMPIKRRKGFEYLHIAATLKNRFSEPFIVTVKYDEKAENQPLPLSSHVGQEMDYVLEGQLKVQVDNYTEILSPGDSIYYDSTHRHGMIAIGGGDAKFLAVVIKGDNLVNNQNLEVLKDKVEYDYDNLIYKQFVNETLDENGSLTDITFNVPDNFNFGYDVVDALAKKCPNKVAMTWVSHDNKTKHLTFKDISDYSNKTANYLMSLGVKSGDRVMLVLKRHYQFWFAITALHKIGAVAIPATNQLVTKDYDFRFKAAGVNAILATCDGDVTEHIDMAQKTYPDLKVKVCVNGHRDGDWNNFDEEIDRYSSDFTRIENSKDDPMLMYFTSGTTGYPKIATHSFSYPLGHIITARYWHNVDPNGLHFTISDTGWGKAVWGKLYGQWLCEAAVFTYDFDKFEPHDILPMIKKYNITTLCAPPTMFRFFIKEDLSKYDLSSLKHATIAGEALNPEVYNQFYEATGLRLMEGFGQTETTLTVANLIGMTPKPGSMGKPSPMYDVILIDSEGKAVNDGEVGEIVLKTEKTQNCGLFIGYYRNKEKTDEVCCNGLYHTGDMAWRDEDGYFWYVGRTDDLIKSSGYRIGPFEIESVIMELPYVMECAITGVPDDTRGQVVKATVVLVKDKEGTPELKKEIQTYVKEHTAPYKYPRIVEFVTELPKTISGKIKRAEIRKEN